MVHNLGAGQMHPDKSFSHLFLAVVPAFEIDTDEIKQMVNVAIRIRNIEVISPQ